MRNDNETKSPRDYEKQQLLRARENFKNHVIVSGSAAERRWVIMGVNKEGKRESFYWTEIVALENGHLLAHGDIDACMFGRSGYKDPVAIVNWIGKNEHISGYVIEKANIGFNCSHHSMELTTEFEHGVARWQVLNMLRDREEELLADLFEERYLSKNTPIFKAILDRDTEEVLLKLHDPFIHLVNPELDDDEAPEKQDAHALIEKFNGLVKDDKEASVYQSVIDYLDHEYSDNSDPRAFYNFFYEELSNITSDAGEIISDVGSVPSIRVIYAFAAIEKLSQLLGEAKDVG
jgi:hypothetical protein